MGLETIFRIVGFPKGTLVRIRKDSDDYSYPISVKYGRSDYLFIPPSKFVGVIVRRANFNEKYYLVRWIADKRRGLAYYYIWREDEFEVVQTKST